MKIENKNIDATIEIELTEISTDDYWWLVEEIESQISLLDGGGAKVDYDITKKYEVTND